MITREQVEKFTKERFNEENVDDRITDHGFAYHVSTQSREFLGSDPKDVTIMLIGNGPLVILKETGDVYSIGSGAYAAYKAQNLEVFMNALHAMDGWYKVDQSVPIDRIQ